MDKIKKAPCTAVLVGVNVVIFLALSFIGRTEDASFMLDHGAMYLPKILEDREIYRLVTSMFLHFGFEHLFSNMITLTFLGAIVEKEMGTLKYISMYLISGIVGNLLSMLGMVMQVTDVAVAAGASGAIFGINGVLVYIAIQNRDRMTDSLRNRIIFMTLFSLYMGFRSTGVDNGAHIGGFIAGMIMGYLFLKNKYQTRRQKYGR